MRTISTHVLDTARGRPAAGMRVTLEAAGPDSWQQLGDATTNDDGRVPDLLGDGEQVHPGVHRLTFHTGAWFAAQGVTGFYPQVVVEFEITDATEHHHVPLLLSPFGYSTYRGS